MDDDTERAHIALLDWGMWFVRIHNLPGRNETGHLRANVLHRMMQRPTRAADPNRWDHAELLHNALYQLRRDHPRAMAAVAARYTLDPPGSGGIRRQLRHQRYRDLLQLAMGVHARTSVYQYETKLRAGRRWVAAWLVSLA